MKEFAGAYSYSHLLGGNRKGGPAVKLGELRLSAFGYNQEHYELTDYGHIDDMQTEAIADSGPNQQDVWRAENVAAQNKAHEEQQALAVHQFELERTALLAPMDEREAGEEAKANNARDELLKKQETDMHGLSDTDDDVMDELDNRMDTDDPEKEQTANGTDDRGPSETGLGHEPEEPPEEDMPTAGEAANDQDVEMVTKHDRPARTGTRGSGIDHMARLSESGTEIIVDRKQTRPKLSESNSEIVVDKKQTRPKLSESETEIVVDKTPSAPSLKENAQMKMMDIGDEFTLGHGLRTQPANNSKRSRKDKASNDTRTTDQSQLGKSEPGAETAPRAAFQTDGKPFSVSGVDEHFSFRKSGKKVKILKDKRGAGVTHTKQRGTRKLEAVFASLEGNPNEGKWRKLNDTEIVDEYATEFYNF